MTGLKKSFPKGKEVLHVLRGIDMEIRSGKVIGYLWKNSGCMSVTPMVIVGCLKGVMSGVFFIISVFLDTIFTLLFANAIYLDYPIYTCSFENSDIGISFKKSLNQILK